MHRKFKSSCDHLVGVVKRRDLRAPGDIPDNLISLLR